MFPLTRLQRFTYTLVAWSLLFVSGGIARSDDEKSAKAEKIAAALERARETDEAADRELRKATKTARQVAEKGADVHRILMLKAQEDAIRALTAVCTSRVAFEKAQQETELARNKEMVLLANQVEELQKQVSDLRKEVRRQRDGK